MEKKLSILAICGSLRSGSAHHAILQHLKNTNTSYNFEIYNGLEAIPNFNPEIDGDDPPPPVIHFRTALAKVDAVMICTPEYAYGIPGALKNALDWTVSSGSFVDKPVAAITASGLGEHAHASLLLVLTALNAKIIEGGTLLIQWFRTKLDIDNNIIDAQTESDIQSVLRSLTKAV